MKIKVIACKVLLRELYLLALDSPHTVDILWLRQKLHNEPDKLRTRLQAAINDVENEEEQYDAIVLAYGLCSNGVLGLGTKKTPLVVPRAHDCITLLLGSRDKYQSLFKAHEGGIYWYAPGWIEQGALPSKQNMTRQREEYVAKYGEENADYLMEMEQIWMTRYDTAAYIRWRELENKAHETYARDAAEYLNWQYKLVEGDKSLLQKLLFGQWDEDFLVLEPGQRVAASFDETILRLHSAGQPPQISPNH